MCKKKPFMEPLYDITSTIKKYIHVSERSVQTSRFGSRDQNKQNMSSEHGVGKASFWSYDVSKFSFDDYVLEPLLTPLFCLMFQIN